MISQHSTPPAMSLSDILWARLHRSGWRMTHSALTDQDSGHIRHLVHARRGDTELICTAPTMSLAIETVHRASLEDTMVTESVHGAGYDAD